MLCGALPCRLAWDISVEHLDPVWACRRLPRADGAQTKKAVGTSGPLTPPCLPAVHPGRNSLVGAINVWALLCSATGPRVGDQALGV